MNAIDPKSFNLSQEVHDYTSGLRNIVETSALAEKFEQLIGKFGYRHFIISGIPDDGAQLEDLIVVHNLPEAWVSEYLSNEYFNHDPIVRRCLVTHDPFYWKDMDNSQSTEARRIMSRAEHYGLTNGLCYPIHNINGFEAGVSISGSKQTLQRNEMKYLYLASIMTFNALRNFRSDHSLRVGPISAREIEILTWCAVGKTSKEIAYILFISENTVNVHIKNAIHKLSAKNKTEAVAIAARKGIISI